MGRLRGFRISIADSSCDVQDPHLHRVQPSTKSRGGVTAIDRLRSAAENVKWVEPDNLHWTLQFLGDLSDVEMAEVCLRTVRTAAKHEAFTLEPSASARFLRSSGRGHCGSGQGRAASDGATLQASIEEAL